MGTSRSPVALVRTTLAPSASITEPMSPAGSAWASDPPIGPEVADRAGRRSAARPAAIVGYRAVIRSDAITSR